MTLIVEGMKGLGDNIYQRIVVQAAAQREAVYLKTPWPELYEDLPIRFLPMDTPLRTQRKNLSRQPASRWSASPPSARTVRIGYGTRELADVSLVRAMESALPLHGQPFVMDLPTYARQQIGDGRPLAIVRPVTVRTEWRNEARNPRPEYVAEIAAALMASCYVVSVADLQDGEEWLLEPAPPAHARMHRGELSVRQLLGLVQAAAVVVGGVGWIVPAAIAARVPAYVVLGGHGGHNAPEKLSDPRMDLSRIGWAVPDRFCRCADMRHRCDKTITNLTERFQEWWRGQTLSAVA